MLPPKAEIRYIPIYLTFPYTYSTSDPIILSEYILNAICANPPCKNAHVNNLQTCPLLINSFTFAPNAIRVYKSILYIFLDKKAVIIKIKILNSIQE